MDTEETLIRLSKSDARKRGLVNFLSLKYREKPPRAYLADIAHPRGVPTIMEVYRIMDENRDTYTLEGVTPKEMDRLLRKYNEPRKSYFNPSDRSSQRK